MAEEFSTPRPAVPVLPSRAAGDPAPPPPPMPGTRGPAVPDHDLSDKERKAKKAAADKARRTAKRKAAAKPKRPARKAAPKRTLPSKAAAKSRARNAAKRKSERLEADEIARLNAQREAALVAKAVPPVEPPKRRGPGRPPRDPNAPRRKRGRPPGSGKRGPGRPARTRSSLRMAMEALEACMAALSKLTPSEKRDVADLLRADLA